MRKSDFVREVAAAAEMTQRDTEKIIDALPGVIKKVVVEDGEEVSLPFGKFKQKVNPARTGINPLTQKPLQVEESHSLGFKAAKAMKIYPGQAPAKKSKPAAAKATSKVAAAKTKKK